MRQSINSDFLDSTSHSESELSQLLTKSLTNRTHVCGHKDCSLTFRRKDDYDRHEYTHTNVKKYKCSTENCTKTYINQSHLKRHVRTAHRDPETVDNSCDLKIKCKHGSCASVFKTNQKMKIHYDKFHTALKQYKCGACEESFNRKSQLKRHNFKHTGVYPYTCDDCGHGSINQKAAIHHRVSHKKKLHKCTDCYEEFEKWSLFVSHRKEQHAIVPKFICDYCKNEFVLKVNLRMHIITHTSKKDKQIFKCEFDNCPNQYLHLKNLKAHIRSKHNQLKFECDSCGLQLSTKQKLVQHFAKIHIAKPNKVQKKKPTKVERKYKERNRLKMKRVFKSMAAELTNVAVSPDVEKMIIANRGQDVELLYNPVSEASEVEQDDANENRNAAKQSEEVLNRLAEPNENDLEINEHIRIENKNAIEQSENGINRLDEPNEKMELEINGHNME